MIFTQQYINFVWFLFGAFSTYLVFYVIFLGTKSSWIGLMRWMGDDELLEKERLEKLNRYSSSDDNS